jgi:hypothetical protein
MGFNYYHQTLLLVIYDAIDRVRDIPSDKWCDDKFCDVITKRSNLFGHYVRMDPKMIASNPAAISHSQYMIKAAPLSNAINELIDFVLPAMVHDEYDAYSMVAGVSRHFSHPDPKTRAMDILYAIENKFPREVKHSFARETARV